MESSNTLGRTRRLARAVLAVVCLVAAGAVASPGQAVQAEPAAAAAPTPRTFRATPVQITSRVEGAKAPSARYAESDASLLQSTSADLTSVAVKLDYDALASYQGHLRGLEATSPSVTGKKLDADSGAVDAYTDHIQAKEAEFLSALAQVAPEATVTRSLQVVYGGVAIRVPANKAKAISEIPGVLAVQKDEAREMLTDSSTDFIGAPHVWEQLGGQDNAGEGVVVGILDGGAWPEHPSFADDGSLPAPPAKADGTPRTCAFGDNPLTPANDPFSCNNKLIGGAPFLDAAVENGQDPALPETGRDFDGHGTHTASTSVGVEVEDVELLGVHRGTIRGVAPGAHLSVYRVCATSCYVSDSAAAVGQAILDGVDVINFSISGGTQPFTDPVELAFLDAYKADVFVATSAGNSGPDASTANHLSPWTTTVAASTQDRAFESVLTLTSGADTVEVRGASVTQGAGPAEVVVAADVAGYDGGEYCEAPAPAGLFEGQIVVCQRGVNARVEKGYNVLQGGAAGMVLYNPMFQDVETDSHWLPTIHIPGPDPIAGFLETHTDITGTFTPGNPVGGKGDIIAGFSSRGPAGNVLKPDITAPGVQILAGHSPAATEVVNGPSGEYFQAIAGTSMSSPHIAGSGALLAALHPDWDPGQIKSALMTTARTDLLKEDEETPADPFDFGAGHVDLTVADDPGITISETVERMIALGNDPDTAIDQNLPSVYAPRLPGRIRTLRTAYNTTDKPLTFEVSTTATAGASIKVSPKKFTVHPGSTQTFEVTIDASSLADGTNGFGQITLDQFRGPRLLHLPVAFTRSPGDVTLEQTCDRTTIGLKRLDAECTVTARNDALDPATVDLTSVVNDRLNIRDVEGALWTGYRKVEAQFELAARVPGDPSIAPGASPAGGELLPLAEFGAVPTPVGDEEAINIDVPPFEFGGETWTSMGITSDGYLVAGEATAEDVDYVPQDLPNPVRPNNVIAPFWTDTSGEDAPGISVLQLTDNVSGASWIVVEWDLNMIGTTDRTHFQAWIGLNGPQDISFTYDWDNLADPGERIGLTVGAENYAGTGGDQIDGFPTEEYVVSSTAGTPGGSQSYTMTIRGRRYGAGLLTTTMVTDAVRGDTVRQTPIRVGLQGPG